MIKRIALIFGAIFVLVGILGFVPMVTPYMADSDYGRFLGVFAVDPVHNGVHILTGAVAIAVGLFSDHASRIYFRVFGIVYALVALLGFYYGNQAIAGMMANNLPAAALHTVIAAVALFLGFGHLLDRFEHPADTGTHHPA